MKKMIFGLVACIAIWTLLQVQSFNSALYLFVVLGLNPFTNKPVPQSTIFLCLAAFGFCMSILIFSREINILINAMVSWVRNPDNTNLSVELELLKEPKKPRFNYRPKLPTVSFPKTPKTPSFNVRVDVKPKLKISELNPRRYLPNFRIAVRSIFRRLKSLVSLIGAIFVAIGRFALKSVKTIVHLVYLTFRSVKATALMFLMGIGLAEIFVLKTIHKFIRTVTEKLKLISLTMYAITRDLVIYSLVLAGYSLLISILVGFIVWRLSEPFVRKADHWLADRLHESEQASHMIKVWSEMFATFISFRRELKSIRRSFYR